MARVPDEEVVAFLRAGHTQAEAATYFEINERTVRKKLKNVETAEAAAEAEEARRAADKARTVQELAEAKRRARLRQLPPGVPPPQWLGTDENGEEDWQPWIDSFLRLHPELRPEEPAIDEPTPPAAVPLSLLDISWWWHAQSRAWTRCQRIYVNAGHRRAYRRQQQHYRSGAWRVQERDWSALWGTVGLLALAGAALAVIVLSIAQLPGTGP